jgi:ABC-2 type transport system ATP-binding protein
MTAPVIEARDLHKSFGPVKALDGLDLLVQPGQVVGFLGPNGAGKSTTIRVLLGLLRRDARSGAVAVFGLDPWRHAVELHKRLAYVPGDVALWPNLTGGETIDLLGRLRGGLNPSRRTDLVRRFELDPSKKTGTYSKGNRQKIALIAALASDAELLILDEPTAGLDPLMEAVFTQCVRELRDQGHTVLLSSHILAEVEKLCDTIAIIRSGRTVESGTLDQMRHLTRTNIEAETAQDPAAIAQLPGVHDLRIESNRVWLSADNADVGAIVAALSQLGVRSLLCSPPSLEQVFLGHYGAELAADGAAQETRS